MIRLLVGAALVVFSLAARAGEISVLVYHDISPKQSDDEFTVRLADFRFQMHYLQQHGYRPISLQYLRKVQRGKAELPKKAVLLTFDDGFKSYQRYVVPLLKKHGFPSVVSVVTSWMAGRNIPDEYRGKVMDRAEVRRVSRQPLVEVISHSHDMHYGVPSNPQGNEEAVAITREYNPRNRRYESERTIRQRIKQDLLQSRQQLRAVTGRLPLAIAWPYGQYNQMLVDEARRLGMVYYLTLDDTPARLVDLPRINRVLVRNFSDKHEFVDVLRYRKQKGFQYRFIEINLDRFIGKSRKRQERMLSALIRRIELLGVNTVILSPFSRSGRYAFFHNQQVPVINNILNRILHQVRVRNDSRLYLKLPLTLKQGDPASVYRDLARLNRFHGVIFTGRYDKTRLRRLISVIRYYRPAVRFGLATTAKLPAGIDFRYRRQPVNIENRRFRELMRQVSKNPKPDFIVLTQYKQDPWLLAKRMRSLRSYGIRDFGFTDRISNQPLLDPADIATEIQQRSFIKVKQR